MSAVDPSSDMSACTQCNERFSDGDMLHEHICADRNKLQEHMGADNKLQDHICADNKLQEHIFTDSNKHCASHVEEKSRPFVCELCNRRCILKSHLKTHMLIHNGQKLHRCESCGKTFRHKCTLLNHVKNVHAAIKPNHVCDICQQTFTTRFSVANHIKWVHNKEKNFECEICTKQFTTKDSLQIHARRHHTDERPYVCDVCQKQFKNKSSFRSHISFYDQGDKIHRDVNSHVCVICQRNFSNRGSLSNHIRFVHDKGALLV